MEAIRSYDLEKAEVLQLINLAPRSVPVLFNTIEECEQRFTDEQIDEILGLCETYLGFEPVPEVEAQEGEEQAEDTEQMDS